MKRIAWDYALAERVGFEPTNALRRCQFSRLVPSTTRPPLRNISLLSFRSYGPIVAPEAFQRSEYRCSSTGYALAFAGFQVKRAVCFRLSFFFTICRQLFVTYSVSRRFCILAFAVFLGLFWRKVGTRLARQ